LKKLKNPPVLADARRSHPHRSLDGTPRITASTCWPQPAQVVLPQLLQVTGRHIRISSVCSGAVLSGLVLVEFGAVR
jgi:hypothetical protein